MSYLEIILRTVIIFITIFIWSRILGKKLVSHMTFFDFVAGISLGSLVASSIMTPDIHLLQSVISISLFAFLSLLLGIISFNSLSLRKIINSGPAVVIKDGEVQDDELKKARLTIHDLMMLLRKKDVFYIDQIEAAMLETDGTLSVLIKPEAMPPTKSDLNTVTPTRGLPYNLVVDGQPVKANLQGIKKDENWLRTMLQSHGIDDIEVVSLCQIDRKNQVYIHKKSHR
ncbi:uncharacterized membrane protein YcaP (DUF421 family) [Scopulibacillus darangshiensis]|uniref:Uncharacterized membrane protein YcaP (DUF421 family) n=1 Tax=Scopulibacillus darangshiensis TaxID=442528 RepID=A0A4R2P863_9BACL|nr:DUF421 domain-containing protein [Scopulibacillus darangshiensis]TCP30201.1 uncharacterized membrane protein YcaP (DUF421 family) [Scopulibacillus darangshiensis]